jgi:hypothetical protein
MKALWSRLSAIKHFDKVLHFGACFVATLFSFELAIGLSIGKEYGDYNNPNSGWSWWDIVEDGLGIVTRLFIKNLLI